ncbi:hypothetical protein NL676_005683 [Syzygium grande]|nr:hypothetical protein NL676_005683 [Syzygium grande]
MEACGRHVLEAINEMATLGGGGERVGRFREAVTGLEKETVAMSEGADRLREGVNGLLQTVLGIRKRGRASSSKGTEKATADSIAWRWSPQENSSRCGHRRFPWRSVEG